MIDFFIGRSPIRNWNAEDPPLPIQKTVRELLHIARNAKLDRRKNTTDRRRLVDEDFIVTLTHRRDRRVSVDRRQNQELTALNSRQIERRKNRVDRRKSVQDGVYVQLQSKHDRRSNIDRRKNSHL
jgi:hypothetical protein